MITSTRSLFQQIPIFNLVFLLQQARKSPNLKKVNCYYYFVYSIIGKHRYEQRIGLISSSLVELNRSLCYCLTIDETIKIMTVRWILETAYKPCQVLENSVL